MRVNDALFSKVSTYLLCEYATLHTPEMGISITSELCEYLVDILSFLRFTVQRSVQ